MRTRTSTLSPRVTEVLNVVQNFTATERLILARLLLDSILNSETEDDVDWMNLSLASFQKDWDNPEDAIYDNWRELYDISER
jgi:hypothetical protein